MRDKLLYQSPAIDMSMDTADYYNPDWACLVDFLTIWAWDGWGFQLTTLDLSSQSGAFDQSAKTTPNKPHFMQTFIITFSLISLNSNYWLECFNTISPSNICTSCKDGFYHWINLLQALKSMWNTLKLDPNPEMMANFEQVLSKLTGDVQKKTMEQENMESTIKYRFEL